MNISKNLLLLILFSMNNVFGSSLPSYNKQIEIFDEISKKSYRNLPLDNNNNNNIIISEYLIRTINSIKDEKSFNEKLVAFEDYEDSEDVQNNMISILEEHNFNIEQNHPNFIKIISSLKNSNNSIWNTSFWNNKYGDNRIINDLFLGHYNNLSIDGNDYNTPRTQQFILNCREFLNFKDVFTQNPSMISHLNFKKDDVIRALSLCGTFCFYDNNNQNSLFYPSFSGMLVPDQTYSEDGYYVHSCLHGFMGTQAEEIYFVPYGIRLDKDGKANLENSFKVSSLWKYNHGVNNILEKVTQEELDQMDDHSSYNSNDYICVKIRGQSTYKDLGLDKNKNLYQVMVGRQKSNIFNKENFFPEFIQSDNKLPNLLGNNDIHTTQFEEFKLNKKLLQNYYVIGRPGDPAYQLDLSGFVIVTNLTDSGNINPYRSLQDDSTDPMPSIVGKTRQISSDFPNYFGMSGGPVLKTIIIKDDKGSISRISRFLGTVWGLEREYKDEINKNVFKLSSFINLP